LARRFRLPPPAPTGRGPWGVGHCRGVACGNGRRLAPKSHGYFASEGGLADGPLLFPGCPGILDESCWRTARLWSLMSEPVVSPEGFTAGPLLLPGLPTPSAPFFPVVSGAPIREYHAPKLRFRQVLPRIRP